MDENLKIDGNTRWVLGAITNDGNMYIRNVRVNPNTGALIVEANVTSNNTQIGSTIPGATQGSVFFAGLGGTLEQDNSNFFWDDASDSLGIRTSTPGAALHVDGDVIITGDIGTSDQLLGRDSSTGEVSGVSIGSGLSLVAGVLSATGGGGGGYSTLQDGGTPLTQRSTANFVNYFTLTDDPGNSRTDISINTTQLGGDSNLGTALSTNTSLVNGLLANSTFVTGLANDPTFLSTLDLANISGQIDLTTQVSGLLPVSNIDVVGLAGDATFIATLEPNLDLANIGGQLSLGSQVSGVLPLANGGTGSSLSDPGADRIMFWDDSAGQVDWLTAGSGLSISGTTITATGSAGGSPFTKGQEFQINLSGGQFISQIAKFGTWTLAKVYRGTSGTGDEIVVFSVDSNTGALTYSQTLTTSAFSGTRAPWGVSISEDGSTLYILKALGGTGAWYWELKSYNSSFSVTNTYTSATFTNLFAGPGVAFFVSGSNVIIQGVVSNSAISGSQNWQDWTISGASLTSQTATNLEFYNGSNYGVDGGSIYARPYSGKVYLQKVVTSGQYADNPGGVRRYAYASPNFTVEATSTDPIASANMTQLTGSSVAVGVGGFEMISGTVIGRWRNTTTVVTEAGTSTTINYQLKGIYNEYTF